MVITFNNNFTKQIHEEAFLLEKVKVFEIPKQFPNGIDAEKVMEQAKTQSDTINGLLII
jgi:hypothetical protein